LEVDVRAGVFGQDGVAGDDEVFGGVGPTAQAEVRALTPAQRLSSRYAKFRAFGHFTEPDSQAA
jgi:hypothetical protein